MYNSTVQTNHPWSESHSNFTIVQIINNNFGPWKDDQTCYSLIIQDRLTTQALEVSTWKLLEVVGSRKYAEKEMLL